MKNYLTILWVVLLISGAAMLVLKLAGQDTPMTLALGLLGASFICLLARILFYNASHSK